MEHKEISNILDLTQRPAFCVAGGTVTAVNPAAGSMQIPLDAPVESLLISGREEYRDFRDGSLTLSVSAGGVPVGATVHKMDGWDLFILDSAYAGPELQALALAARELRGPLERLMLVSEDLFPKLSDTPELCDDLSRINRALFQLQRLIGNMSDAGAGRPVPTELQDVTAVAAEIFEEAAELCAAAGCKLVFTNLPVSAHSVVDRDLLERGIYNILSNSLKFAPGSTIRASLTLRRSTLYFTVHDNGPGLGSAQSDVFHRYLREPALEPCNRGIGLGMAMVRAAAAAHGGTVMLHCPPEGGTRTVLSIPIRQDAVVRSRPFRVDYTGDRSQGLVELSESLPPELYAPDQI